MGREAAARLCIKSDKNSAKKSGYSWGYGNAIAAWKAIYFNSLMLQIGGLRLRQLPPALVSGFRDRGEGRGTGGFARLKQ